MISNIANYVKYNYFLDDEAINNVCCNFENSQISAQDTVGVMGDDIMYQILVNYL